MVEVYSPKNESISLAVDIARSYNLSLNVDFLTSLSSFPNAFTHLEYWWYFLMHLINSRIISYQTIAWKKLLEYDFADNLDWLQFLKTKKIAHMVDDISHAKYFLSGHSLQISMGSKDT